MPRFDNITPGLLGPYTYVEEVDTSSATLDFEFQGPVKSSLQVSNPSAAEFDDGGADPTVTTNGDGSGATINSITVNADGEITVVDFNAVGSGYAADDLIYFTQSGIEGTYELLSADVTGTGRIRDLSGKTIAPSFIDAFASHRAAPVVSGGSGSGAVVDEFTVNAAGEITALTFSTRGTGYQSNDEITLTQGGTTGVSALFRLRSNDIGASGALQDISAVGIAADNTAQSRFEAGRAAYARFQAEPTEPTAALLIMRDGAGQKDLFIEVAGNDDEHLKMTFSTGTPILVPIRVTKIWEDDGQTTPTETTADDLVIFGLW